MKQAFSFIVILTAIVVVGGMLVEACSNYVDDRQPIVVDCTNYFEMATTIDVTDTWDRSIYNDANDPFIVEVAFNNSINPDAVSQEMFDDRYCR